MYAAVRPVLSPGEIGGDWWDALSVASPVVLLPNAFDPVWRMWYYGRDVTTWVNDVNPFLPTGRIGMAASEDGIAWRRIRGPLPGGAAMDPASSMDAFDSTHVGVGDVVQLPNGTLWMYYFGGGSSEGSPLPGIRMQIGLAASNDNGLSWERLNGGEPVLCAGAPGAFDALFVAWPRVLPPWETKDVSGLPNGTWYMSYHTYNMSQWSVGAAVSGDGLTWERLPGPVLEAGGVGTWDSVGVGVRSVTVVEGHITMFYEAVDSNGGHAIGLAESDDGIKWKKCCIPGCSELGGPLLVKGPSGAFDEKHVGTPYIVPPQQLGGNWRLYYVGANFNASMANPGLAIGVAESSGSDFIAHWRKIDR